MKYRLVKGRWSRIVGGQVVRYRAPQILGDLTEAEREALKHLIEPVPDDEAAAELAAIAEVASGPRATDPFDWGWLQGKAQAAVVLFVRQERNAPRLRSLLNHERANRARPGVLKAVEEQLARVEEG